MTSNGNPLPEPPEWLKSIGALGLPEFSDRDAACLVLSDLDYDSQLIAVRYLLHRHREADQSLRNEILEIEEFARRTSGVRNEHAVDEWTSRVHDSVYQDAAHSMAAVGMLAPLIESVFYQAFQAIRQYFLEGEALLSGHERWKHPAEDQWDCHFCWNKGKRSTNLVEGIFQLADAVGLAEDLPSDLKPTLEALFAYRNKMFHCGFEWPTDERNRFQRRLETSGWPATWFADATRDGEPWIFYLTDSFVDHCLTMVERIIEGIGAFCKRRLLSRSGEP